MTRLVLVRNNSTKERCYEVLPYSSMVDEHAKTAHINLLYHAFFGWQVPERMDGVENLMGIQDKCEFSFWIPTAESIADL